MDEPRYEVLWKRERCGPFRRNVFLGLYNSGVLPPKKYDIIYANEMRFKNLDNLPNCPAGPRFYLEARWIGYAVSRYIDGIAAVVANPVPGLKDNRRVQSPKVYEAIRDETGLPLMQVYHG